jgi:hypothetical protein
MSFVTTVTYRLTMGSWALRDGGRPPQCAFAPCCVCSHAYFTSLCRTRNKPEVRGNAIQMRAVTPN